MARSEWASKAMLLLAVAAIAAAEFLTPPDNTRLHYILPRLYYLPIVFAALNYGWRGGLIVALLSSGVLVQQIVAIEDAFSERLVNRYLELISFCTAAVLIGVYTNRERHRKKQYQELAVKLSGVYETLQTNFEGMKRAERLSAIGRLSAGLAHEIRNPLASIAGAASILRRHTPAEPKVTKCLDIIDSECKRLNGLLTNFLNFARPRQPQFQLVNVEMVIEDVIALAQHAIGRTKVNFRKRIAGGLPDLQCDPEQLRQVLLNLLINAVEASGPGAIVTLMVESSDDSIVIRVVDEGSGVAPEDIDKLFDPFFTTKESGTGLGLPVAHQIVGHMGGLLAARRNPDRGMTFSITLPIRNRTAA